MGFTTRTTSATFQRSRISRAVATVEAVLGATVFDRSTRTVRLTDVGREFVERATLVNAELDAAVRAIRPQRRPTPRLSIASLTSVTELYLASAVSALGSVTRLRCIEGLQSAVEAAVVSGQATAGIGDLAQVRDDLVTRPLWREPFRLAVPAGSPLAGRAGVTLDDLSTEPLIGFSRDAELRSTLDRELATARQLRAPDFIVDRYRTALSLVATGSGVMVVPSIVLGAMPAGTELIELDHPDLHRTIGVLNRTDTEPPEPLLELIDRIRDVVSEVDGVTATR